MPEDSWDKIEATFHEALERPLQDRAAFLDAACAGDAELRREVESLLTESSQSKNFMESPAGGLSIGSLGPPSLEGRSLNHYEIGALIGSGGMAEVYRARDTKLGRNVAIKVLHHARYVDPGRLDPIREARVIASLNHPNIAAIYGIEEADGLCGLVLELVEGETLADRIRRKPFDIQEALGLVRQIVAGLQAAHAKGIIHRDLKPSNIKMTADGTVKLLDFGVAKLLRSLDIDETLADISEQGPVMGTVAYMSPEQARGRLIDVRTDVWALGCVFYEILAGRAAFRGDTPTDIIVKIASEEPDWNEIPTLPGHMSRDVERLIRVCLQKDPDGRFSSVHEVAGALDNLHTGRVPKPSGSRKRNTFTEEEFVMPAGIAFFLFMFAQAGYIALYAAAMYHIHAVVTILVRDFELPATASNTGTMILAMCGIAVRLYLISAVGWRHRAAGRKFTLLFPILLILDGIWSASPLLLWHPLGWGPAFLFVAFLAYVPFAQRKLIRTLYPYTEEEFVMPAGMAFFLFMFAQAGYIALYAAAMSHIDAVATILADDFPLPATASLTGTMILAMCGIAVRLYLISAVGWRHPAAGRKFTLLFPVLLILDGIWSASPLLLWQRIGPGVACLFVAFLAYVPFAQRTLIRTLYPKDSMP